eukprot:173470-Amorphochlora_amoeboformis.AAC.2
MTFPLLLGNICWVFLGALNGRWKLRDMSEWQPKPDNAPFFRWKIRWSKVGKNVEEGRALVSGM